MDEHVSPRVRGLGRGAVKRRATPAAPRSAARPTPQQKSGRTNRRPRKRKQRSLRCLAVTLRRAPRGESADAKQNQRAGLGSRLEGPRVGDRKIILFAVV